MLLAVTVCLSFSSCLLTGLFELGKDLAEESERHSEIMEKQKEEMAALVENYSPAFKEKAAEVYGSGAELTDIRCVENYPEYKNDGYVDYAEALIATLTVDGKQYEAVYSCYGGESNGRFSDTVHTDVICSEPANALPLDKSQIIEIVYPMTDSYNDYGEKLKFDWDITNYDEWVACDNVNNAMKICVYTTQDVGEISENEILSSSVLKKMENATSIAEIVIVSVKDTETLEDMKQKFHMNSSLFSQLAYPYETDEAKNSFFDKFHLKGVMIVDCGLHNKGDHPVGERWDHNLYINVVK